MTSTHVPTDCDLDVECIVSITTNNGLIVFDRKVEVNTRYFICAQSNASAIEREWFTEKFNSISSCSNGFVIDTIPPKSGHVFVKNNKGFLTSRTDVMVHWDAFADNIYADDFGYPASIKEYYISCGNCYFIPLKSNSK